MQRKQKTTVVEDIFELVSLLPWWLGVILAFASYIGLHIFALPDPPTPVNAHNAGAFAVRAILKALATVGQYLVPLICLAAAAMSAWRSKSHATHTVNTAAHNADGLFQPGSVKSSLKGLFGELQSTLAKKVLLDANVYEDINNVTLPTSNGTTQIDHIIVSRFGIFVIETKNMSGWIFGDEKSPQWTQSLPGGKKFQFQNPLHQNYKHVKALQEFLGVEEEKIFSVVMFWGEAEFKTPMPANVMTHGYVPYIKSKCDVLFTGEEMDDIILAIKTGMLPKTWSTGRQHVADLKARFASTTICPKCGSTLALRTMKSGAGAGSQFYGCSGFPKCRYVKKLED